MDNETPIGIKQIDHVVTRTRNLAQMIAFYSEVLGCVLEKGPGDNGLAQLRAGSSLIDLVDADGTLGRDGGGAPDHRNPNMDHVCFSVEPWDEPAIRKHLESHGVVAGEVATRYGADGYGPSIYLEDPEGNRLELKGPSAP